MNGPVDHDSGSGSMPTASAAGHAALRDAPGPFRTLDVRPGTVIAGRYKLLQQIGQGGFGVVFLAEQEQPVRRKVAVKLIKLGMDTEQVIARFESERQALALLSHPNVAAVYDAGATESGRPYFVMEYVPGEPITTFCDRHNYTTRQRLELFIQACDAIQHAHQKAIIHRDVKPSNLLVMLKDDKPLLKVIDFGVAKATAQRLTERTLFTEHGQLIGTPEYMSPEQAEMNALDVDTRTDIYSLGVVLYELLTGAVPFDSQTLRKAAFAQIQRIIREQDPPRPSTRLSSLGDSADAVAKHRQTQLASLHRELRGDLEWIPLKALRKDRSQRYHTAVELAQDVRNYLEHQPLIAGPESTAYRARKFLRRNKGPVAATAAVFVTLLCGVLGTALGLRQAIQARDAQADARKLADQSAAEARREAAKQAAINHFLNELFASANPLTLSAKARVKGKDVTVAAVMDEAVRQLDIGSLKDRPEIEAGVRRTIGNVYLDLGEYTKAEPQLLKALELAKRVYGEEHREVAAVLSDIAALYAAKGKRAEAQSTFEQALAMQRKLLGEQSPEAAATLYGLADVLKLRGKIAEGSAMHAEALRIRRRVLEPDHPDLALSLRAVARGDSVSRRNLAPGNESFPTQEELCREALAIQQRKLGPDHPETAMTNLDVARILRDRGRFAEAEPLFEDALVVLRRFLGPDHPDVADVLVAAAGSASSQGKFPAAEKMLREALDIQSKKLDGNPIVARTLDALALILERQEQIDDAQELYRRGVDYRFRCLKPGHGAIRDSLLAFNQFLYRHGRYAEAEEHALKWLKDMRTLRGDPHADVANALVNLASVVWTRGKLLAAEPLYREALDIRLRLSGPNSPSPPALLVEVLHQQGRFIDEDAHLQRILELQRNERLPKRSVHMAEVLLRLGRLVESQGRFQDAEAAFREALEIQTENEQVLNFRWMLDSLTGDLGRVLLAQKKYTAAVQHYRDKLPKLEEYFGHGAPKVLGAERSLLKAMFLNGEGREAHELTKKVAAKHKAGMQNGDPAAFDAMSAVVLALVEAIEGWDTRPLQEECERDALAALSTLRPKQDAPTAKAMTSVARLLSARNKLEEAETLFRESLVLRRKLHPEDSAGVNTAIADLTNVLEREGKYAAIADVWRETLALRREKLGQGQLLTLNAMNGLAWSLYEAGNYADGLPVAEAVFETLSGKFGRDFGSTVYTADTVGYLYEASGQHQKAAERFEDLLTRTVVNLGPSHASTLRARISRAFLYEDMGEPDIARELMQQAFHDAVAGRGDYDLDFAAMLTDLASDRLRNGKLSQAEPLLRVALDTRKKRIPGHWRHFNAESMLGEAVRGTKSLSDAETLLISGANGLIECKRKGTDVPPFRVWQAIERVVKFYVACDRPENASKWRAKLVDSTYSPTKAPATAPAPPATQPATNPR